MVLGSWTLGSVGGGSGYPHSLCWCGQPLPCSHFTLPISPTSEPGQPDTPGMRSRSLGRALACPARSEHSRKQPQGPRALSVGRQGPGCPGQPPTPTPGTSGGGMGGGDVMSSFCLTCPSFLLPPPSASHPSRAVTCAGKGPLEVGGASIPGYPGLSKTLERVVFYGGSCPSPIRLCNRLCSFHRWLPPPSPEMSGRRLPVSYTGAPQSLGAPSPRVRRWRCC